MSGALSLPSSPSVITGIASEECGELSPPKDLVEIGVFGPPHGVHGEIRLQAITDTLEDRLEQPGVR